MRVVLMAVALGGCWSAPPKRRASADRLSFTCPPACPSARSCTMRGARLQAWPPSWRRRCRRCSRPTSRWSSATGARRPRRRARLLTWRPSWISCAATRQTPRCRRCLPAAASRSWRRPSPPPRRCAPAWVVAGWLGGWRFLYVPLCPLWLLGCWPALPCLLCHLPLSAPLLATVPSSLLLLAPPPRLLPPQDVKSLTHQKRNLQGALNQSQREANALATQLERASALADLLDEAQNDAATAKAQAISARGRIALLEKAWASALEVGGWVAMACGGIRRRCRAC